MDERVLEVGKAVQSDSKRPDVSRSTLDTLLIPEQARRMEKDCALDVLYDVLAVLHHDLAHSEVTDLGVPVRIEENVLWFDISVQRSVKKYCDRWEEVLH